MTLLLSSLFERLPTFIYFLLLFSLSLSFFSYSFASLSIWTVYFSFVPTPPPFLASPYALDHYNYSYVFILRHFYLLLPFLYL